MEGGWVWGEGKAKWSMRRCQRTFNGLCKPNFELLVRSRQIQTIPPFFSFLPVHIPPTMSEKQTGYRLEYASSNRSKCKGQIILFGVLNNSSRETHCLFITQLMVGSCSDNRS